MADDQAPALDLDIVPLEKVLLLNIPLDVVLQLGIPLHEVLVVLGPWMWWRLQEITSCNTPVPKPKPNQISFPTFFNEKENYYQHYQISIQKLTKPNRSSFLAGQ